MKSLNIKMRIVITTTIMLVTSMVLLSGVAIYNARVAAVSDGIALMQNSMQGHVRTVQGFINKAFIVTADLKGLTESSMASGTVNRDYLNMAYERALKDNQTFFGTWIVTKPNGLGDSDADYKAVPGSDKNGVFTPYFVRDGNETIQDTTDPEFDVSEEYGEEYFKHSWDSEAFYVSDPYAEELTDGSVIVMTSTSAPTYNGTTKMGVAGIDFELSGITNAISSIKPYETGYAVLISQSNMIVSHPNQDVLGGHIEVAGYSEELLSFLKKKDASHQVVDIEGTNFYAFTQPITFDQGNETWELVVFAPESGVLAHADFLTYQLMIICAILVGFAILASWVVGSRQAKPIVNMSRTMGQIAEGNLNADVEEFPAETELGQMSAALNHFKTKAKENEQLQVEAEEMRKLADERQKLAMAEAANRFESEVSGAMDSARSAVSDISTRASSVVDNAGNAQTQNKSAYETSEMVAQNVSTVASSVEELSASIREISSQTQNSRAGAMEASEHAQTTSQKMEELVQTVEKINEIGSLIQDIAEQTNLLALNATIEAARAGDAGKGFAVVASEVKNLAGQTAKATEQISQEVEGVQQQTRDTAKDLSLITAKVDEISNMSTSIAAAVEEQSAATGEISRAVQEAASGTSQLQGAVSQSLTAAEANGEAASAAQSSSEKLSSEFDVLRKSASEFVRNIRQQD